MPPEFGISEERFVLGGHIVAEIAKFLDDYAIEPFGAGVVSVQYIVQKFSAI